MSDHDHPAPPSRAALAAVLAQAADAEPLLADHPVGDAGGSQRIDLANGWRLALWWHPGPELARLWAATAPDGGIWSFGCDRWPDWNAGPEAVVLEPLRHLITPEQRAQLQQRLLTCSCWPAPDPLPEPPSMAEIDERFPFEVMAS
jgi:nitrogen fixation protein